MVEVMMFSCVLLGQGLHNYELVYLSFLALQGKQQSFGFQDIAINMKLLTNRPTLRQIRYQNRCYEVGFNRKVLLLRQQCGNMSLLGLVNNFSNKHEWHTFTSYL